MSNERWAEFAARFGTEEADEAAYLKPAPILKTGFESLDEHLMGGLRPGPHFLMAPPGLGKSSFALNVSLNVARRGGRVLFCSIEMSRQQCLARLSSCLSTDAKTGLAPVSWSGWERGGKETARRFYRAVRSHGEPEGVAEIDADPRVRAMRELRRVAPGLAVSDGPGISDCSALAATAREGRAAGLNLLVIDYLQRLRPPQGLDGADSVRRVAETVQSVTELAKSLQIPVLVITSMSREAAKSGKPSLFAAKGAGDIEFDAVSMWQLTRTGETATNGMRGIALHVLKARIGIETGDSPISLGFDGAHSRFEEWR